MSGDFSVIMTVAVAALGCCALLLRFDAYA